MCSQVLKLRGGGDDNSGPITLPTKVHVSLSFIMDCRAPRLYASSENRTADAFWNPDDFFDDRKIGVRVWTCPVLPPKELKEPKSKAKVYRVTEHYEVKRTLLVKANNKKEAKEIVEELAPGNVCIDGGAVTPDSGSVKVEIGDYWAL